MTTIKPRTIPIWLLLLNLAAIVAIAAIWLWPLLSARGQADHATALHDAARAGDTREIARLLRRGADPNARDEFFGMTPLHGAAANGHTKTAQQLLKAGADPDAISTSNGHTPLYWALENDHIKTVRALLAGGCDPNVAGPDGWTPLHLAAALGSIAQTKLLLEYGADVSKRDDRGATPLALSFTPLVPEVVAALLDAGADPHSTNDTGATALHSAAAHLAVTMELGSASPDGEDELKKSIDLLIRAGADVDARGAQGATPLFIAASHGSRGAAEHFVSIGADPGVLADEGRTIMHYAANGPASQRGGDRVRLTRYLLKQGAAVDAPDDHGLRPVHLAAWWANQPLLELLLEQGAEVDVRTALGAGTLYFACQETDPRATGRLQVVRFLIERGAAADSIAADGNTPLHMAARYGHADIAELLMEHGADADLRNDEGSTAGDLAQERGYADLAQRLRR